MKKNIIILGLISLLAVSCGDDFLTTHPGDSVSTDLAPVSYTHLTLPTNRGV